MTGERLKHILYVAGISQTELAEKLGTTQQNLYGALKAQDIKIGFLEKLCEVLNVKMSFFYPDDFDQQKVDEANRKVLDYDLGGDW